MDDEQLQGDPSQPHTSEKAFLGCCLLDSKFLEEQRASGRKSEIFSSESAAKAWEVMMHMRDKGLDVNIVTLYEMATELGVTETLTMSYVATLTDLVETTAHAQSFLSRILAGWRLRTMKQIAQRLQSIALQSTSFDADREKVEKEITTLSNLSLDERDTSFKDDMKKAIANIAAELKGEKRYSNELYTGLKHFDANFGPIDVEQFEDNLVVVAAGPSVGKSSLTRSIAWENVKRGKKGCVFLLETNRGKYGTLMASQASRVNLKKLDEYNHLYPDKMEAFAKALNQVQGEYAENNLFVYDNHYNIEEIESRCRHIAAREGKIDFVVIDYVQLVGSSQKKFSREQEVAEVSRRCKIIGKDLKCTVFAVAQLNREGRKLDRPPVKEDLRESGALEQDADRIILLHRPETYRGFRNGEQTEIHQDYNNVRQNIFHVDVIQDKMRNGPTGKSSVLFERTYTLFYDYPNVSEDGSLRKRGEY